MLVYRFVGGIADGAETVISGWKDLAPPGNIWVRTDPEGRGNYGMLCNVAGNGCPYALVGIDADHVVVYHVHEKPSYMDLLAKNIEIVGHNG